MATYAKALYAALVAGLGALAAVLVGDTSVSAITAGQWVTAVLAALIAAGGVWNLPYRAAG